MSPSAAVVPKVVCVTGASGYIASWLVKLLLNRGYVVHASVRSIADTQKFEHLRALDGAGERLHLFEADLLIEGSFDAAIRGCDGVFHTASPVLYDVTDPKTQLIDPAVKGTLNVLGSCLRTPTVKRVIITSSLAAVAYNGKPKTPDVVVDETWFSSPEFCEQAKLWYCLAKTLAEEAAWKFSKENGLDIVTLHPGGVLGPLLQPRVNNSTDAIQKLINGSSDTYPNITIGWLNVKDVAMAHVLAYEVPSASGRYCLAERVVHFSDVVKIIKKLYPHLPCPDKCDDEGKPLLPVYQVSQEKVKSLGVVELVPLEVSIKETVESLLEKVLVTSL